MTCQTWLAVVWDGVLCGVFSSLCIIMYSLGYKFTSIALFYPSVCMFVCAWKREYIHIHGTSRSGWFVFTWIVFFVTLMLHAPFKARYSQLVDHMLRISGASSYNRLQQRRRCLFTHNTHTEEKRWKWIVHSWKFLRVTISCCFHFSRCFSPCHAVSCVCCVERWKTKWVTFTQSRQRHRFKVAKGIFIEYRLLLNPFHYFSLLLLSWCEKNAWENCTFALATNVYVTILNMFTWEEKRKSLPFSPLSTKNRPVEVRQQISPGRRWPERNSCYVSVCNMCIYVTQDVGLRRW